jgi:hypothetical protein
MANPGYIEVLVGNLPAEHKGAWKRVMDYLLRNLRFGPVANQARTENFQAYYLTGTTASVANQEFSVAHGLGRVPYVLIPVLALESVNQTLPPLTVSRAADEFRVYLKCATASAAFAVMVE